MGFSTQLAIKFNGSLGELKIKLEEILNFVLIHPEEDTVPSEVEIIIKDNITGKRENTLIKNESPSKTAPDDRIVGYSNSVFGIGFSLFTNQLEGDEEMNFKDFQYAFSTDVFYDELYMEAAVALSEVIARRISMGLKTEVMVALECQVLYSRYKLGEQVFKDSAIKKRLFDELLST